MRGGCVRGWRLEDWIKGAQRPRLVIIDTLAMVRPAKGRDENGYDADCNAIKDLRDLAGRHGVAIVIVHHLRKAEAEDPNDMIVDMAGLAAVSPRSRMTKPVLQRGALDRLSRLRDHAGEPGRHHGRRSLAAEAWPRPI